MRLRRSKEWPPSCWKGETTKPRFFDGHRCTHVIHIFIHILYMLNVDENVTSYEYRACNVLLYFWILAFSPHTHIWRQPCSRFKIVKRAYGIDRNSQRDHKMHVKPLPGLVRLASAQMTQASLFASVFVLFGLRSCFCSKHPETTLRQWGLVEMGRFYTRALQRFRWKRACAPRYWGARTGQFPPVVCCR